MSAPAVVEFLTAALVLVGAIAALIGSVGLLRLGSFLQRVHAPSLASTLGTWSLTLATALQMSFVREELFLHALLIPTFIAVTTPVTTIFLVRAALFRGRAAGHGPPPAGGRLDVDALGRTTTTTTSSTGPDRPSLRP